jgi:4-diphosphocytidyl-2C-methyl-D-erythritol kinase
MELHNAYHEIRSLQIKISEYDTLIKNAQEPELKVAYSTIQSVSAVKLSELQTKMVHTISTLVGNPAPK